MNTGNETQGKSGLGGFSSMIAQCCGGAQEGKGQKFDFTICKQMMKSFCADKDGKRKDGFRRVPREDGKYFQKKRTDVVLREGQSIKKD